VSSTSFSASADYRGFRFYRYKCTYVQGQVDFAIHRVILKALRGPRSVPNAAPADNRGFRFPPNKLGCHCESPQSGGEEPAVSRPPDVKLPCFLHVGFKRCPESRVNPRSRSQPDGFRLLCNRRLKHNYNNSPHALHRSLKLPRNAHD
jgi:hypothetical protein